MELDDFYVLWQVKWQNLTQKVWNLNLWCSQIQFDNLQRLQFLLKKMRIHATVSPWIAQTQIVWFQNNVNNFGDLVYVKWSWFYRYGVDDWCEKNMTIPSKWHVKWEPAVISISSDVIKVVQAWLALESPQA